MAVTYQIPKNIPIKSIYVILGFTLCTPYINGDPCGPKTESLPRRRTPMTSCTDSLRMESMTSDETPKPNKKNETKKTRDGWMLDVCLLVGGAVFVASNILWIVGFGLIM